MDLAIAGRKAIVSASRKGLSREGVELVVKAPIVAPSEPTPAVGGATIV